MKGRGGGLASGKKISLVGRSRGNGGGYYTTTMLCERGKFENKRSMVSNRSNSVGEVG